MKNNYKEVRSMSAGKVLLQIIGKTAALAFLLFAFTATSARAQDVCYVDTGGDNAQNGQTAGTANETIAGCLAETYVGEGTIISIEAGTYNESVIVTEDLIFEARETGSFNRVLIDDVTIRANVIFRQDTQEGTDGIFRIGDGDLTASLNVEDGSLTIQDPHASGRLQIPAGGTVTRDNDTEVTGEITYLGVANVVYTDDDATDADISAGGELPSALSGGTLNVDIGDGNVLSFSSVSGIDTLDVAVDSELDGTIVVDRPIDIAGPGGNVGNLDVQDDVTISGDVAVNDVSIANDNDITFALGANTLTVNGDFERLGGTFTSAQGSELAFRGDESDATFGPGPNFQIAIFSIDKDGQTLSITEDVTVNQIGQPSFLVAEGTTVDFAGNQVNIDAGGTDVDGTMTNLSTIVYRTAGTGIRGDGVYGNILVTTGGGDIETFAGAEDDKVRFSGTLTLSSGGINVQEAGDDISPFGDDAAVTVNLATAGQAITGPGTFNELDNEYDLEYTGDMGTNIRTVGTEFATDDIRNLTFNVENGTVDAIAAADGTISGDVSLNEAETDYTVQLDGEVTVAGNLLVGDGATLDAIDVILQGAANSVIGTVSAATTLSLQDGTSLTGDASDEFASTVGSVEVDGDVTVANIQQIDGNVTTNADATLSLGLADEMTITGNVTLDGASAALTSDINVGGDVNANAGSLAFGSSDIILDGNFIGAADVSYTSSGGVLLFMTDATTLTLNGEAIPHVEINDAAGIVLGSEGEISESLVAGAGSDVDVNGNALTVGGEISADGGNFVTDSGAGSLTFNTATLTLNGDATITPATSVAEGATLTLASVGAEDEHQLDITGDVSLSGALHLHQHDVQLAADLLNAGGEIGATSGSVIMNGGDIEVDGSLTIPNLTIAAATVLGGATDGDLTVSMLLVLNATLTETDENDALIIGDGATIIIGAATPLAEAPDFDGSVDLVYEVATDSGNEIPAEGEGTVGDVDVNDAVTLQSDLTVNGTLSLAAAIDDGGFDLILGDGATLSLEIASATALAAANIQATNYTLEYAGPGQTIADAEFVSGATVTELIIDVGDADTITNSLSAGAERVVNDFTIASGTFQMSGIDFNVAGDLTMAGDDVVNNSGTDVNLTFVGGDDQAWSLSETFTPEDIDIELMKSGVSLVTLTGGGLDLRANVQIIHLGGGILQTDSASEVFLYQDSNTHGFERDVDEEAGEASHISGNVTKRLLQGDPFGTFTNGEGVVVDRSARFEYPTGSAAGEYRPFVLTFLDNVVTSTNITVNHEDTNPGGTAGLPLSDDSGLVIGNYPDYFWLVDATTSLGQSQAFDVELTSTEIGIPFTDESDLRIIRRFDGDATTNQWSIQGSASNYSNFVSVDAEGDTTAVVRVESSTGGIVTQGARFTLGLPSRGPIFASDTPDTLSVSVGGTLEVTIEAAAGQIGASVTFSLDGAPAFVAIDANTGVLTAEPQEGDAGTYTFDIVADDGTDTATHSLTLVVGDTFSITPAAVGDTTIVDGQTLTIDFDVDPETDVTFTLDPDTTANAEIDAETGVFTFTPAEDQVDSTYTFTVSAANEVDTSSVTFNVTVQEAVVVIGDVTGDGALTLSDVSLVLAAVIGDTTLSAEAQVAADVSGAAGVSAFDAALMLQCIANHGPSVTDPSVCNFPADEGAGKSQIAAVSNIAWGEMEGAEGTVYVPVLLKGTVENVYSIDVTARVDLAAAQLTGVKATLPDGWQLVWSANKEAGTVRVVAVGSSPISYEGEVARLVFDLKGEEIGINLTGEAFVNENPATQLGDLNVKEIPTEFALGENYPNPFNPTTTFTYSLPEASHVTIEVYDVSGRLVQTLVDAQKDAGRYEVRWDGQNSAGAVVASGLYLYRIKASSFTQVKTMMLVK